MLDLTTSLYVEMVLPSHVFTLIHNTNPWINSKPHGTVDPVSSPNGPLFCEDVIVPIPMSQSVVTIQATKMDADGFTLSVLAKVDNRPLFYGIMSISNPAGHGTLKLCDIKSNRALTAIAAEACSIHAKSKFIQTWRD